MKLMRAILVIFLAGSIFISPAHGAQVDVTGTNYDLGVVQVGQYGSINTAPVNVGEGVAVDIMTGALLPGNQISFTYTGDKPYEWAYG